MTTTTLMSTDLVTVTPDVGVAEALLAMLANSVVELTGGDMRLTALSIIRVSASVYIYARFR